MTRWIFKSGMAHLFVATLILTDAARASVDITEFEWRAWPDFCKSGYLSSYWGNRLRFPPRMTKKQAERIEAREGLAGSRIAGVHHFCVGMVELNRASGTTDRKKRSNHLNRSLKEIAYSYDRIDSGAPRYSLVAAYYGKALFLSGNKDAAVSIWTSGIQNRPSAAESYLAMAEALLSEDKNKEALDILLRYDEVNQNTSAEVEYFLGHTYFELGRYEEARKHADKAYALGYPLPGLRNKLRRIQHQAEEQETQEPESKQ